MKLIYRLIMIGILLTLPVMGATMTDMQKINKEVQTTCSINHTQCNIRLVNSDSIIASTNEHYITISTATIKYFTKEQLRSVVYHEMAHKILRHSYQIRMKRNQIWDRLGRDMSYNEEQKIRHRVELEADSYASFLLWLNNKPNKLDDALWAINILSKRPIDEDTLTHPSLHKRLTNIHKLKILYGN